MRNCLSRRLQAAISLAVEVHGGMKRKGDGLPYIVHPIAVLSLLTQWEADEDTCIAGLLHDVLEDAPEDKKEYYRERIQNEFGDRVLGIIEDVTEQDKSLPWKERKKRYLEHLETASEEAVMVSCADLTHNLASLVEAYREQGEDVWKRFNAVKQWKVWSIDQRTKSLTEKLPEENTEELRTHLEKLNELLAAYVPSDDDSIRGPVEGDGDTATFIMDPLYESLWDYCALTEQEMEDGMLEETKRAIEENENAF